MSKRPTQAEEAANGCSHASSIWSGNMKHGTCNTCGAKWDEEKYWHYEANPTHEQEVEEQKKLHPDIGWCPVCNKAVIEIPHGTCCNCFNHTVNCESSYENTKLREKDAKTIAEQLGFISDGLFKIDALEATIAQLKEDIKLLNDALDAKITICGDETINSLKEQLSEVRAREAMWVDALKWADATLVHEVDNDACCEDDCSACKAIRDNPFYHQVWDEGRDLVQEALSASSTEVAKYLAEHDAKVLEEIINAGLRSHDDVLFIKSRINELRSGK